MLSTGCSLSWEYVIANEAPLLKLYTITPQSAAAEYRRWSGIGAKACRRVVLFGSMGAADPVLALRCLLVKSGIGAGALA